jgi:hypothetical protein
MSAPGRPHHSPKWSRPQRGGRHLAQPPEPRTTAPWHAIKACRRQLCRPRSGLRLSCPGLDDGGCRPSPQRPGCPRYVVPKQMVRGSSRAAERCRHGQGPSRLKDAQVVVRIPATCKANNTPGRPAGGSTFAVTHPRTPSPAPNTEPRPQAATSPNTRADPRPTHRIPPKSCFPSSGRANQRDSPCRLAPFPIGSGAERSLTYARPTLLDGGSTDSTNRRSEAVRPAVMRLYLANPEGYGPFSRLCLLSPNGGLWTSR